MESILLSPIDAFRATTDKNRLKYIIWHGIAACFRLNFFSLQFL